MKITLKLVCTHCGHKQRRKVEIYTLDYELSCTKCKKQGELRENI